MQQQEKKPLTEKEQVITPEQRIAWQRECFQNAQKYLAEKGIMPKSVVDKDSRFLAPLCAMWKFKAQMAKRTGLLLGVYLRIMQR